MDTYSGRREGLVSLEDSSPGTFQAEFGVVPSSSFEELPVVRSSFVAEVRNDRNDHRGRERLENFGGHCNVSRG